MTRYRFDQIAENSTAKKKPEESDRNRYVGLEHLDPGTLEVTRWGAEVTPKGDKLLMKKGDVLFGRRRAYQKKVGIAPFDGIFSAHGMVLRPKADVVDPMFFPFFISSDMFLDEAIRVSVGSLSPTANWKDLRTLEFDLPSPGKQRELAGILSEAESLKGHYRKLLTTCDDVVKSQFVEIFSKKEFPLIPLSQACTKITDGTHKTPQYQEAGIAFISAKNVTSDGKLDFSDIKHISTDEYESIQNRCETQIGDVLLTKSGSLGMPAIVDVDFPIGLFESLAVLKYRRDILDGVFLREQLKSARVQDQFTGGVKGIAVKHLHLNVIGRTSIIVPPLELQEEFTDFVLQVDKSKFAVQKALDELNATTKKILNQELGLGDV
ncbi:restriction endonuclease subunit S [Collinsella sp. AF02-46-1]|jgi:type I restriction enzyme, S subunit|uniref:restriction endonuclease subunit S n=1 Tax=unclassified Collinsella TaxID=2637548 RepID=UPI000E551061|nr:MULTISPECIES: restriction endonuclease subunit S [unclassified Collinsella]RGX51710.1 restriction endonuclease subunit S [Collinsella sp. AF02-46-1]RHI29636.1 restriction endonuclease subunit S [Collinsella sp. AM15-2]